MFAVLMLCPTSAISACTHSEFLNALANRESSMNPTSVNGFGYAGLFQMGEAALQDAGYYRGDATRTNDWTGNWTGKAGINSLADFLNNPDAQIQAVVAYQNKITAQIHSLGLDASIGKTINGVPITKSGLVAGAHLVGIGNLSNFINSNGANVPRDGNGIPVSDYVAQFGGCTIDASTPTFSALSAATGTTVIIPPPPVTPSTPISSSSPAPFSGDADTVFMAASGKSKADIKQAIAMILATFVTTWVAWTGLSSFASWRRGRLSSMNLQGDIVRAACILVATIVIVN
jgi:hypothetical protein